MEKDDFFIQIENLQMENEASMEERNFITRRTMHSSMAMRIKEKRNGEKERKTCVYETGDELDNRSFARKSENE